MDRGEFVEAARLLEISAQASPHFKTLELLGECKLKTASPLRHPAPGVHRRTLQRDLRGLLEKGLLAAEGATNNLVYRASSL